MARGHARPPGTTQLIPRHTGLCYDAAMRDEFIAIIEQAEGWFIAYSPEIPGANGQGRTKEEALKSLASAIELILEDGREDGLRGVPPTALRETVTVG